MWSISRISFDIHFYLGVEKVDISLEKQEVVVDTELPRETVLAAIKKTGKTVKE